MIWLKKARRLAGFTANELAHKAGISLNYIQRLENGSRSFDGPIRDRICSILGFSPETIRFDSELLLSKLSELEKRDGANGWCRVGYERVNGRIYYTAVEPCEQTDLQEIFTELNDSLMRICHAKDSIQAQAIIYDGKYYQD